MKQVLIIVFGLVAILLTSFAVVTLTSADSHNISWTKSTPTLGSSLPTSNNEVYGSMYCPVDHSDVRIDGLSKPVRACMVHGDDMSFATYSRFGVAVSFRDDKLMYPLHISCKPNTCAYLPQTDTLIMTRHKVNNILYALIVYKNFSNRLERHVNPSNLSVSYYFDYQNPSYELKGSNDKYWSVVNFAGSDNGRFLAIELRERGVALLDIDNLTTKYITGRAFMYWRGVDPNIEFAVSNDGRLIAEMGRNAGIAVLEVDSGCGGSLDMQPTNQNLSQVYDSCPTSPIDRGFITNFRDAYNPKFSSNGDSLSFFVTSRTVNPRKIELRASGYNGSTLDYLALGDSFSSGEGALFDSEYLTNTNKGFDKCHISNNSYPFILARMQSFDMNYVRSVACSGAVMDDVVGDDKSYWGQRARMENYSKTLTKNEKINLQSNSYLSLFPGRIHQANFTSKYHPSIITLGIGGNDIGFADKLKACLGLGTCNWAGTAMGKEKTAIEIKSIYDKLVRTYRSVHDKSPNSQLLVVGYPKLIYNPNDCGGLTGYLLNTDERQFINEGVHYLNQVIKSAATTVGVGYVDIEDSLGRLALCGDKPSAMNAVRTGDDSAIIEKLAWLKLIGNESFHPNILGHAMIASKISHDIANLADYNYCSDGLVVCPVITLPPEPSEYWVPGIYHNYPRQIKTNFVTDDTNNENLKSLTLPQHSLSPNAELKVTIASEEQTIGIYQANGDGSLDQIVSLPPDLEPGYHTLNIYSTSFSDEQINLYQVITYKMPIPEPDQQIQPVNQNINNIHPVSDSKNELKVAAGKTAGDDNWIALRHDEVPVGAAGDYTGGTSATPAVLGAKDTKGSITRTSSPIAVYVLVGVGIMALSVAMLVYYKRRN